MRKVGSAERFTGKGARWFVFNRHAHGRPGWALKIGPLYLLRWAHDPPQWFLRRGRLFWLAGSVGRVEVLFRDRGLC